jgi:glycosyltransferase involved in cell wall biosynthesis
MSALVGRKLLVVASLTPTSTANYLVHAFRQLGCEIRVCSDVASDLADVCAAGAVHVSRVIAQVGFEPDYVVFVEGGSMRLLPVGLECVECLTAWYGIDTHMDYAKHLRIGRLFDVTFLAQKEYVERMRTDGIRQVHWLPLGFAEGLLPSPMPERTIDIAYVGSEQVAANPLRHALLEALRREFSSTRFGAASPNEMGRIYAGAKLVFNKSVNNDVNMRFFEAAGAGAVLVTDRISNNGVEELFEEGKHYVSYQDHDSLIQVMRGLLADPQRCAAISKSAHHHVLEHHTYRHRAQSLLAVAGRCEKLSPPCPEDYFAACLSLNLLSDALRMAAQAITMSTGSSYRKYVGALLVLLLNWTAHVLGFVERMRFRRAV